ncbi:MAG: hypothetical protein K2Z80_22990, partial [Xanthobacteraceae bacterium]|nr:hypothetical protein [Xanthobacteraceae bacterium]MBX9844678.1 hypothetical protein [Xanthobacteraceae bacterium]
SLKRYPRVIGDRAAPNSNHFPDGTRECARLKQEANADPEKRRAWANVVPAWSYLDRLLLAVRATEDRLGIECIPR